MQQKRKLVNQVKGNQNPQVISITYRKQCFDIGLVYQTNPSQPQQRWSSNHLSSIRFWFFKDCKKIILERKYEKRMLKFDKLKIVSTLNSVISNSPEIYQQIKKNEKLIKRLFIPLLL